MTASDFCAKEQIALSMSKRGVDKGSRLCLQARPIQILHSACGQVMLKEANSRLLVAKYLLKEQVVWITHLFNPIVAS